MGWTDGTDGTDGTVSCIGGRDVPWYLLGNEEWDGEVKQGVLVRKFVSTA